MAAPTTVLALVTVALGVQGAVGAAADWEKSSKPELSGKFYLASGAQRHLLTPFFFGDAATEADGYATGVKPASQSNYQADVELNGQGITSFADGVSKASSADGTAATVGKGSAFAAGTGRRLVGTPYFAGFANTDSEAFASGKGASTQSNYLDDVEINAKGVTSNADGVTSASSKTGPAYASTTTSAGAFGPPGRRLLHPFFIGDAATEADGYATGVNPASQSNYQADVELNNKGITSFADGVSKASSADGTAATVGKGSAFAAGTGR